ncbi:MAG: 50S ribosomal protein L18 [Aureispira sp.]|nr:50S ribosomal protein L18 [Aureispira sp.]
MSSKKTIRRKKIHRRIRKAIVGTTERPRLSVFRSNKQIYAQIIDDSAGKTLAAASSLEGDISSKEGTNVDKARMVGQLIAKKAMDAGVTSVIFDRSGYLYHGRVKALAEGARGERKEDGTNEFLQF